MYSSHLNESDPVRVLIVDDSPLMRKIICRVLAADPDIEIVGQAGCASDARAAIKSLDPDVVTLDIQMPGMNGLDFLQKIMDLRPTPVIIISSLTGDDAEVVHNAKKCGAADCISKPSSRDPTSFNTLAEKIKVAASSQRPLASQREHRISPQRLAGAHTITDNIVAIGSSTGGVEALVAILSQFPENCPPTVITQHMPMGFTRNFAKRLNKICLPQVSEASSGDLLVPGHIYIAPGSEAHLEIVGTHQLRCKLTEGEAVNGHRPSIDVLFHSVAKAAGFKAVGVILTGMGHDGAAGLLGIRQDGGRTIGQDEKTCVIYGMPKTASEIGAVETQLPLDAIAAEILAPKSPAHVSL
jgi:two-component system chemotaxis response regulator CheB